MDSHQTFSGQNISICLAKSNLTRQIHCMLSLQISLSLLKIMNAWTIFGPYHKHSTHTHARTHAHTHTNTHTHTHTYTHTHTRVYELHTYVSTNTTYYFKGLLAGRQL